MLQLGVDITCGPNGCPPVHVRANGLKGGEVSISGKVSSQFMSALLMAAPFSRQSVSVKVVDELISAPYVHMTTKLMAQFGVKVDCHGDSEFVVQHGQRYRSPGQIVVEVCSPYLMESIEVAH